MNTKGRQGFTLIEILIVVAIIAILASVVLVGLGPTQRAGRDARRISDLRNVQNGLELFYNRCGYYPGTLNCGAATPQLGAAINSNASWLFMTAALQGTTSIGVSQVPDDPNTANHYQYGSGGTGNNTYMLGAQLEDLNNSALAQSPNVTTLGVPCSKALGVYCVQL